ncbi:MAG: hypothetical protein JXQ84_00705, partial [Rhodospirillaceae bacterium]|nr:hypothetical protein [Rhodospirillaceae bacterium]
GGVNNFDTLKLSGVAGASFGDTQIDVLTSLECLDLRDSTATTTLSLSGSQVQNIVDGGGASSLVVYLDNGSLDTFTATGEYTSSTVGSVTTYTYYTDAGHTAQMAEVNVYYQ